MKKTIISVFGLGHIGLPTAALFANADFDVIGVDINPNIVDSVNMGLSPIIEPGLDELIAKVVKNGRLTATTDGGYAARESNTMIVVVPTPLSGDKSPDLSAIIAASKTISKGLKRGDLVIIESTVPPTTCEGVILPLLEESGLKVSRDFGLAYTPERALPNNTLYEMTNNARVIGGVDDKSAERAASLYSKITSGDVIKVRDIVTAEMVKLMENTYRDTNIALANELAIVCESLGIDAIEAIEAANFHPRVNLHTPGPGVGGHCLSIDPYFIVEMAENKGVPVRLIKTARQINEEMPYHVIQLIKEALKEAGAKIENTSIGILGVAYKGNVADARETPSKPLIGALVDVAASVIAHDPYVKEKVIEEMGATPSTLKEALNCDCVVLMTDHDEYQAIEPEMIKGKVFICTRPILSPKKFKEKGIIFKGVGRP